MNKKIKNYLNRSLLNKISKNYRYFINFQNDISLKYFFWLNNELFFYENKGFCIKKKKWENFHVDSFVLYYYLRNMKINQLFFTSNPFIFFLKKKSSEKKNKKIFLL